MYRFVIIATILICSLPMWADNSSHDSYSEESADVTVEISGDESLTMDKPAVTADQNANRGKARVKDVANILGVRSNQLTGYGLVIGLDGTGDSKSSVFTAQALANMLERFGITVQQNDIKVKNVAAVMITAELPPFVRIGSEIDVTVSSLGDAKSLQGGTLLQTPLMGADGKIYAVAAGPLSIGGYKFGGQSNVQKNHVLVGRIPNGALVEREVPMAFSQDGWVTIQLRRPDFKTANNLVDAIRETYPNLLASAEDAGNVRIKLPDSVSPVSVVSAIQDLMIETDLPARIVVNERTGVVVIGGNVKIKQVIIAQGGVKVEIATDFLISQPPPLSQGNTEVVPIDSTKVKEQPSQITKFGGDSVTVDQLVKGLQGLGVAPQDLISILQALKDQGALEAELEVQ